MPSVEEDITALEGEIEPLKIEQSLKARRNALQKEKATLEGQIAILDSTDPDVVVVRDA